MDFYIGSSLHTYKKSFDSTREALVHVEVLNQFEMFLHKASWLALFCALLFSQCVLSVHLPRGSAIKREATSKSQRQLEPRYRN